MYLCYSSFFRELKNRRMRRTTKILLAGLGTIFAIFWVSYYVIAPPDLDDPAAQPYFVTVPVCTKPDGFPPWPVTPQTNFQTPFLEKYPEGLDLVFNFVPYSKSYQERRNKYARETDANKDEVLRFKSRGICFSSPF